MSSLEKYWVLSNVAGPIVSSKGTDDYFKVEMVNAETQETLESFIVNNNRNQKKWYDIIEAEQWGVYVIQTAKKKGKLVINADFEPILKEKLSREECKSFALTGSI
tara:strand:+ start:5034 stop:5351 length:318 start_codon:yes stop_codon:yes gene_type:complete